MRIADTWVKKLLALSMAGWVSASTANAQAQPPSSPTRPDTLRAPGGQRTHTVKKGDTLWAIAQLYLSDPFLWPEIYRLNTDVVEDPHWIYPGEILVLSGPGSPPPVAVPIQELSERAQLVAPAPAPAAVGPATPTAAPRSRIIGLAPRPAVRIGEVLAAPFVERDDGPAPSGRVVGATEVAGIVQAASRDRLLIGERIYLRTPGDAVSVIGARYLTYTRGPLIPRIGRVIIPTGIVEIDGVGGVDGTTARIVQEFEFVRVGHGLILVDSASLPGDVRPVPVESGAEGHVIWLANGNVLPTLQHYLILDASAAAGMRVGDMVTLFDRRRTGTPPVQVGEKQLGTAQVVRVTAYGTTVIITDQLNPKIGIGTRARVSAKMP